MKTTTDRPCLTLESALARIEAASAVIVDGDYVTYPNVMPGGSGEDLCLALAPSEDSDKEQTFSYEDNAEVQIDSHGRLVMVNKFGEKAAISLLAFAPAQP